ncbi:hypothetical protein [Streptomyces sp. URMC 129]|uniref:hypothetical protein n=1 Tax=Streptomyces sp. URMC 129 TaxID=3423407 RepID=UPI003F1D18A1
MRSLHELYPDVDKRDRNTIEGLYRWHDRDWEIAEEAWTHYVTAILQAEKMQRHTAVEALRKAENLALQVLGIAVRNPDGSRCAHCPRILQSADAVQGSHDVV